MWAFWPALVIGFLASFSTVPEQHRTGCNQWPDPAPNRLCVTSVQSLSVVRATSARVLEKNEINGAAIERFAWTDEGASGPSSQSPFSIGIVEFDDAGRAWNDGQIRAVQEMVQSHLRSNDTLLVAFVHGWKNDCAACNGNLACFRETLALLSAVERDLTPADQRPRDIVGIYIAWRGRSMKVKYADALSAFGRKATADRIGGRTSDVTSFLAWLNRARLDRSTRAISSPAALGTRLILVGHSFGADVLFGAIAGPLLAEIGASAVAPELSAMPFADLTVLVNPALEASLYRRFALTSRSRFAEGQMPLLVTVQGTNDAVTHFVFPLERALVSVGQSTNNQDEYGASLSAVGHYAPYFTHRLAARQAAPTPAARGADAQATRSAAMVRSLTQSSGKALCGCERLTASSLTRAALVNSVAASLQVDAPDDHAPHIGDRMVGLVSDLEPLPGASAASPFMMVRATPDVIDGHSGIYRGQFFDFLANLVVRVQLLQNDLARRSLRDLLRTSPRRVP
jgi:hypothetical protein